VAILTGTSPLANCLVSTLAYGILHIQGSIELWRLLFIIGKQYISTGLDLNRPYLKYSESAPTVFFSIVVYFLLPDGSDKAQFLAEEERANSIARLETIDHTAKSKVGWSQITAALLDYKNYVHNNNPLLLQLSLCQSL
jgi:hypothetical protein